MLSTLRGAECLSNIVFYISTTKGVSTAQALGTTSRLYIGLAVRLYVFIIFHYFHSCSNLYISAGKGLIKKVNEQIVYLAFSVHVCLILYDL